MAVRLGRALGPGIYPVSWDMVSVQVVRRPALSASRSLEPAVNCFMKVALVAAMLALAFFNRFVAMPRLRAPSPRGMKQFVRHTASIELALGVLVLDAAAILA